jgi:hypothetical protein
LAIAGIISVFIGHPVWAFFVELAAYHHRPARPRFGSSRNAGSSRLLSHLYSCRSRKAFSFKTLSFTR